MLQRQGTPLVDGDRYARAVFELIGSTRWRGQALTQKKIALEAVPGVGHAPLAPALPAPQAELPVLIVGASVAV